MNTFELALNNNQLEAVAPGGSLCQPLLWEEDVTSSQSAAPAGHARQAQHDAHHRNGERATNAKQKERKQKEHSREGLVTATMPRTRHAQTTTPAEGPETQQRVETANFIVADCLERGAPVAAWRPILDARNRRALLNATAGKGRRGGSRVGAGRPAPSGHCNTLARALVSLGLWRAHSLRADGWWAHAARRREHSACRCVKAAGGWR